MRMYRLHLLWVIAIQLINAQTVPPTPIVTNVSSVVGTTTITETVAGCGTTTCGLSDCSCWQQIFKAQCSSINTCPSIATGYYSFINSAVFSATPNSTGLTIVWTDTDPTLGAGTIWSYYMTSNYGSYVPYTTSPPTPLQTVVVPGAVSTVPFSIYLNFNNASCSSNNTCTANAYRALCQPPPMTSYSCPAYNSQNTAFKKLPATDSKGNSYLKSTVSAGGTSFEYKDDGTIPGNIGYNDVYTYVVTNTFTSNPSGESGPSTATYITTPLAHQATVNYSSTSCNAVTPCNLQVWRAQCTSSTSCPTYVTNSTTWIKLPMNGLTGTSNPQGTTWQYQDTDVALANSTTYVWVATVSYVSGTGNASSASAPFIGTTAVTRTLKGISHAKNDTSSPAPTAVVRPN